MKEIEIQLKKLILDDDFTSIQGLVNEEINLMSILRIDHKELQHSNILAWLFDPTQTHRLGDFFIKEFIKLYYKENEYQDLGSNKSKLSVFDFVNLDFGDIEIKREHENIDILILSKSNGLCIMIENKIYAKESRGQLVKYRTYINKEYSDYKHKIFVYLSLFEQEITESEKEYYVRLTYQHIKKIIIQILENHSISITQSTRFVLEQYLLTLKSLMNENEKIEKIAKELYKRYKSAFDLVYKYALPSNSNYVPNNLVELINNEPSITLFGTPTKAYIRFQPNFLLENIEGLKRKGYITEDDDLTNNYLFLFEFYVTKSYINFVIQIGSYENKACRERVYEMYKNNADVFDIVVNKKGELRPSWHGAFKKKIITKTEYNKYLELSDDSIDELIEKRFKELIEIDLPRVKEVFEKELN